MKKPRISSIPIHCAHDKIVKLKDIKPNPRNPNQHPADQVELLAKIIGEQGWRAPVSVSKRSGFIVRGHGRLMAAQLLGAKSAPVDYQDYDTDAEEWADLLADNRLAELAEIDIGMVQDILVEIGEEIDLDLTGFDMAAISEIADSANGGNDADTSGINKSGIDLASSFVVEIHLPSEPEQEKIFNELTERGFQCRVLKL